MKVGRRGLGIEPWKISYLGTQIEEEAVAKESSKARQEENQQSRV